MISGVSQKIQNEVDLKSKKMQKMEEKNKENFLKLLEKMNYNVSLENDKYFFKYSPIRKINKKKKDKFESGNPFAALKELNIK